MSQQVLLLIEIAVLVGLLFRIKNVNLI